LKYSDAVQLQNLKLEVFDCIHLINFKIQLIQFQAGRISCQKVVEARESKELECICLEVSEP
jgi:hypothetical protein